MNTSFAPCSNDAWQQAALKTREAAAAWWRAFTQLRRPKQERVEFPDNLSAATLKDIGAPDWVVSRALELREQQLRHLIDLRPWRG